MAGLIQENFNGKKHIVSISNITRALNAVKKYEKNRVLEGCVVSPDALADKIDVTAGAVMSNNTYFRVGVVDALSLTTGSRTKSVLVYFDPTLNTGAGGVTSKIIGDTETPTLATGEVPLAYVVRVTASETANVLVAGEIDNQARPRLYFPVKPR